MTTARHLHQVVPQQRAEPLVAPWRAEPPQNGRFRWVAPQSVTETRSRSQKQTLSQKRKYVLQERGTSQTEEPPNPKKQNGQKTVALPFLFGVAQRYRRRGAEESTTQCVSNFCSPSEPEIWNPHFGALTGLTNAPSLGRLLRLPMLGPPRRVCRMQS